MRFFYTGSLKPDQEQPKPANSLGGYMSSSVVPNEVVGSMFSEASYISIVKKQKQIRCFALKNNDSVSVSDITMQFDFNDDTLYDFFIGVSIPTSDDCGLILDSIPNDFATPYSIDFTQVESGDIISLTGITILADQFVGVWIKRVLKDGITLEKTCDEVEEEATTALATEDTITIIINYDDQSSTSSSVS